MSMTIGNRLKFCLILLFKLNPLFVVLVLMMALKTTQTPSDSV